MISLRYHVVSIAAMFLALALGVVLGSTSVSERLLSHVSGDRDSLGQQVDDLSAERDSLRGQLARADRFGASVGPLAVRGQLEERTVVLIATPDVGPREREGVMQLLRASGAKVTGDLQLTDDFSDPDRADQLRQVVTRLLPAGVQLPSASDPGSLAGGLIGPLAVVGAQDQQPQTSPDERDAALAGLTEGGFVRPARDVQPADLAVVLTGGKFAGESAGDRAAMMAKFAAQVDRAGAGAVLAGGAGSGEGAGAVGATRADTTLSNSLSTVDDADTAPGQVATVLALREQFDHRAGHYGRAAGAQGAVPGSRG